ncbi:hypothetical protein HHK36_021559 [Tetracentron sinense]|uniref:CUE domain-containing protein n=1 Tax=Tetracentron sinense TaxID=13715 RepID=A0A835D769_TETSI|nr:hypothetical protein HHK36_021559 [Tetracentron sinense]
MSSLNPYAASYVPLSKRKADEENKASTMTPEYFTSGDGTVCSKPPSEGHRETKQNYNPGENFYDFNIHGIQKLHISEDFSQKRHPVRGSHNIWSRNPSDKREKQNMDEDFEMDMAYLAITFPGISDDSLADVYSANGGDLEASVDMLNQLEFYPDDVFQHLPDTLDIGDMSEIGSPAEKAYVKLKKTTSGEASTSSSAPFE